MKELEFIDASAPEMSLVCAHCSTELDNYAYSSNQIFTNEALRDVPKTSLRSQVQWENERGNELDGFFDGWNNNDMYITADGKLWAVATIYTGADFQPLFWREVCRKED